MSLQLILGPSGSGKSHYIYRWMIEESLEHTDINYILLVPEQYSMALQRKMVMLNPKGGSMNIDVIGFNRLAYRVFDEQNIKIGTVLEDFGKTMLIRQAAGSVRDQLTVFGSCLDKSGFIDEVKSLMSEMFQYDVSRNRLADTIDSLRQSDGDSLLVRKLEDMQTIFREFDSRMKSGYIVAEQLTELMSGYVSNSAIIKNSVIVMDGFTGFTPIQMGLISRLMATARDIKVVLTIDKKSYKKTNLSEHELFFLTGKTIHALVELAKDNHIHIKDDIFMDMAARWHGGDDGIPIENALYHLEKNIFRYPYEKHGGTTDSIKINEYSTPRNEMAGVARDIRHLVMDEGYRYRDIAVITGNLEDSMEYAEQLFPVYDIPYFIDYSRPVKNNPYVDAIGHALKLVYDNFSYDSVFSFVKSGVLHELENDDIERLENYCIKKGVRGAAWWSKSFEDEAAETARAYIMELVMPFYTMLCSGTNKVSVYIDALYALMDVLDYKERMTEPEGLYEKLCDVLDKLAGIMPDDEICVEDFAELVDLGLKDLTLGMIPDTLDMVIVGDITRTRLDEIKVLYIVGVNDGVIPKKGTPAQIISDREKEKLGGYSLVLAPTERINSYIEQFYLYLNMTKPKDKLYLSYSALNCNNEVMRPSYIIGRVRTLYPDMNIEQQSFCVGCAETYDSGIWPLIHGIHELMSGNMLHMNETLELYRVYIEHDRDGIVGRLTSAFGYSNVPQRLKDDVTKLVKLRLMSQSVSRLESFASCAYSYFLRYTIGLREREENNIDNRDIGTILHSAMESMYRYVHDECNNSWDDITDVARDRLITGFVNEAFDREYEGVDTAGGRYDHLRDCIVRIGIRTVQMLVRIQSSDNMKPEYFEYRFKESIPYGTDGMTMTIQGIIDRADVGYEKESGRLMLRIIDYKSGLHEFKVNELYEGLQLQLAIYTGVMLELADRRYNGDNKGKHITVVPQGMYYYTMRDPYVEAENEASAQAKRDKELRLAGLVNDGDDRFMQVIRYAKKKAYDIADSIAEGVIDKNPVIRGGRPVCEYCAYSDVCRFDERYGHNRYHHMKYRDTEREEVYREIADRLGDEL